MLTNLVMALTLLSPMIEEWSQSDSRFDARLKKPNSPGGEGGKLRIIGSAIELTPT
jgi:hypothetical protein